MNFRPHGEHSLYYPREGIILAEPLGCWNKEAAMEYCTGMRNFISQLPSVPSRWCRIIDWSQYELHTPDVPVLLNRLARWTSDQGCVVHSYIFSNTLQIQTVDEMFESIGARYFSADDREEALAQCQQALLEQRR